MKKSIRIAALFLLLALFCASVPLYISTAAAPLFSGSGTEGDPYLIDGVSAWVTLRDAVAGGNDFENKYFLLTGDLDLLGQVAVIGSASAPFAGVFDGNGHTIRNVSMQAGTGAGLFAVVKGTIRDLRVCGTVAGSAARRSEIGLLCGTLYGSVEDCVVSGNIDVSGTGDVFVGGIAGYVKPGASVTRCFSSVVAHVEAKGYLGGVSGCVAGIVQDSAFLSGSLSVGAACRAGAVAGTVYYGNVRHCYTLLSEYDVAGSVYAGVPAGDDNVVDIGSMLGNDTVFEPVSVSALTAATCESPGTCHVHCDTCLLEENRVLPQIPHSFTKKDVSSAAQVYESGKPVPYCFYYTCEHCGMLSADLSFTADYIPGDIDESGVVDSDDVLYLMRYLAGWETVTVGTQGDVNGDGTIDTRDVTLLLKYLDGQPVVIR